LPEDIYYLGRKRMKIWEVSMECAGIAEAGGVKNVTFSLCKEFTELKHKVTLFIPVFKCSCLDNLFDFQKIENSVEVELCGKKEAVFYTFAKNPAGFDVVLVNHPLFAEKEAVYTYTENEEAKNSENKKGTGHHDGLFLDVLFQKAVSAYGSIIPRSEIPDILHCQDASAALLPAFIADVKAFKKTSAVVTIHNAGPYYHHSFSSIGEAAWHTGLSTSLLEKSMNGKCVEPFLIAAESGTYLTTVSEEYAKELTDYRNVDATEGIAAIFAEKKVDIKGITNGFDFDRYNPENKEVSRLPFEFQPEKNDLEGKYKCRKFFIQNIVNTDNYKAAGIKKYGKLDCSSDYTREIYIAYHGRITGQKGISVITEAAPAILENFPNVRFIIAGQGEARLEIDIVRLAEKYPGRVTFMNGYNQTVVRLATAVSDFILLPSFFEPCGLEDFIGQVYGTIPVAHRTGGLNKIIDGKTGFLFESNTPGSLIAKLSEIIMLKNLRPSQISRMIKSAAYSVHHEYLWRNVIQKKYLPFFKEILRNNKD